MRFSKAPLIATLMAVALSLLVILPALAEDSIRTDGQLSKGEAAGNRVVVGVFSDAIDAQYDWQAFRSNGDSLMYDREAQRTRDADGNLGTDPEPAVFMAGVQAFLLDNFTAIGGQETAAIHLHAADPRNTFFDTTLYVSNNPAAYNTVLINAQRPWDEAAPFAFDGDTAGQPDDDDVYCVTATVTNERTNARLTVPLVNAAAAGATGNHRKFQNFFEVVSDTAHTDGRTLQTCAAFVGDPAAALDADAEGFPMPQRIAARSGDTLTILVKGDTNLISMVVDGDGPEISSVAPAHGTIQSSEVLRISFAATDELSGLRHDGEQVRSEGPNYPDGDGDTTVSNLDKDNFTVNEPLSDINGRSTDINVWYGEKVGDVFVMAVDAAPAVVDNVDTVDVNEAKPAVDEVVGVPAAGVIGSNFAMGAATGAQDISIGATDKWTAQEVGKEYDFRLEYVAQTAVGEQDPVYWLVEARDRAGNITRSDAVSGDGADDTPYRITIDRKAPALDQNTAKTGIKYDASKGDGEEVTDRQYLAFNFAGATMKDVVGDELDPDSIDSGDFYVEGFAILSYIHPTDSEGKNFDGKDFDPRSSVYVKLDRPLGSGERPEVQLRQGAVRDLAGNPSNGTSPKKAIDRIGPLLTVTVNGAVQDRPVIMADDGELDIEVSADESLRGRPGIWFAKIKYVPEDKTDADNVVAAYYRIGDLEPGSALSRAAGDEMAWSKTYDTGDLGISDTDSGHYAVIVTAVDGASPHYNPGYTAGWTWSGGRVDGGTTTVPEALADDKLDIDKLDDAELIFEVDKALPKAQFSVSPANVDVEDETESRFPFIHIEFNGLTDGDPPTDVGEDKEYGEGGLKDSHSRVVLRSLTVNGTDMLSAVLRVQGDDGQFSLALSRQELGDYEVKYEAVDDAGNEQKDDYTFSVVPRAPYKVALLPGWNLVSLPGTPLDQSIESVMVATSATAVLGYRQGNWESAISTEAEDGTSSWQGSLTSMEGGYGYWIQTDGFESIETLIPEVDPASTLPTVPVAGGWNLLGVIDVRQAAAGKSPLEKSEADDYFTSIPWRVAYSFETIENAWTKLIPESGIVADDLTQEQKDDEGITAVDDEIVNGKGYWVWSSEPGTLVP